ncbi:hypothetical protein [Paracoccus salsus]|uniref:hypothetical protein n=1 Tax=Paracoccus salsus TaxID=2911061 RepID=UPI001F3AA661|nr:hypothetical protein [Paracoccus salsus]MCF3975127.1 hypothetical protein [Paracoccus salsus]
MSSILSWTTGAEAAGACLSYDGKVTVRAIAAVLKFAAGKTDQADFEPLPG